LNSALSLRIDPSHLVPKQYALQLGEVCRYPIRVILANPQVIIMRGLRSLIQEYARHIHVVGEVNDFASLHTVLSSTVGTVVVLDIALLTQILVMENNAEEWLKREAIAHGVRGFVDQNDPPAKLLRGIEALHNGETWLNPIWLKASAQLFSIRTASRKDLNGDKRCSELTKSERETVKIMYENASEKNDVIAQLLNISPSTLRNRLTIIYDKLGVTGKAGLILFLSENKITL
jgi:DNA-binding NarL/FixJ family response regulator